MSFTAGLKDVNAEIFDDPQGHLIAQLATMQTSLQLEIQAKADLIDASVDLDVAQKDLDNLIKTREAQIPLNIMQYHTPAARPSKTIAAK